MRALADFPDAHLRIFDRPAVPPDVRDIYLVGICGTGMGSLAGLLKKAGYRVRGSDAGVYPPMSTHLASLDIPVHVGYDARHLDYGPDLVIVGNACTPVHVEAAAAREQELPQQSFPEALGHFFLRGRRPLVVAGTHGKTSTTGLLVHLLRDRAPGYLVGGILEGQNASYGLGTGAHFIVEGDEYDSAYFDKRPKFMHYRPWAACITSMELDHMDIYGSFDEYQEAFASFAALVEDTLVLCDESEDVLNLARATDARVMTYGLNPESAITATHVCTDREGQSFTLMLDGRPAAQLHLPLFGRHNLLNALAACGLALAAGLPASALSFEGYRGVKRRMGVVGEAGGVLIADDFAHHPTAVRVTLEAARSRWPDRRLVAVFEPRTNTSRRKIFEGPYAEAFEAAALAYICTPPFRHNDEAGQFMDVSKVAAGITQRGTPAVVHSDPNELLPALLERIAPGDVVFIMSNGGFGGLHQKLLKALRA